MRKNEKAVAIYRMQNNGKRVLYRCGKSNMG